MDSNFYNAFQRCIFITIQTIEGNTSFRCTRRAMVEYTMNRKEHAQAHSNTTIQCMPKFQYRSLKKIASIFTTNNNDIIIVIAATSYYCNCWENYVIVLWLFVPVNIHWNRCIWWPTVVNHPPLDISILARITQNWMASDENDNYSNSQIADSHQQIYSN